MTVEEHLRIIRERCVLVLLGILVGVASGAALQWLIPHAYLADAQVYVAARTTDTTYNTLTGTFVTVARIDSYATLASSPRVSAEVTRRLRLDVEPGALAERITTSRVDGSLLITITVEDGSAERAASIADTVVAVLGEVVAELEDPASAEGVGPFVQQVQPAIVRTPATLTAAVRSLVLGVLFGLAAGVGAALTCEAMDRSVRQLVRLEAASGAPNLGRIEHDPDSTRRPLVVRDDPLSHRAEAFRRLRTNVSFVEVGNPHKVLTVTSALPREGKTVTAVNLALALASAGSDVLLVDADLRNSSATALLGIPRAMGLTDVLTGRMSAFNAVRHLSAGSIHVLPSGQVLPNPNEVLATPRLREALDALRGRYGVIVVDTPPLLSTADTITIGPVTAGALLVCRAEQTSRSAVAAATEALRKVGCPVLGTVQTMVSGADLHRDRNDLTSRSSAAAS